MEKSKHRKVAIVTIDSYNYGNRLQNVAVQTLLQPYADNVNTFKRQYNALNKNNIKKHLKLVVGKVCAKWNSNHDKCRNLSKIYAFHSFNKKYINWDKRVLEEVSDFDYIDQNYDILISGSDQIWNFKFDFNSELDLLSFGGSTLKRIALCASIGNITIDDKTERFFKKHIHNYNAISVREESAGDIIKTYYDKDVVTLLDPTMLVDLKFWKERLSESKIVYPPGYIFIYFLGEISKDIKKFVETVAREEQLKIINLNDSSCSYYGSGPIDFIALINNADYVFTDSFHCSVFSILFEKKFVIYDRLDKQIHASNRTDELLKKFNLLNRKNIYVKSTLNNIDFSNVMPVLAAERKRAETFLNNVFH